jgi:hypothetical protein
LSGYASVAALMLAFVRLEAIGRPLINF